MSESIDISITELTPTPQELAGNPIQKNLPGLDLIDLTEPTGVLIPTSNVGIARMSPKAQTMKDLCNKIPNNDYGLPEYIYRADLIPALDDLSLQESTDYLEMAILELDYSQGFPALTDGEPFWAQLPYEPIEAYKAFIAYLDLPRAPSQRLGTNDGSAHPLGAGDLNKVPVRQLHLLKNIIGETTDKLMSHCYMFYWPQRVRAYDLFIVAIHNKRKEQRLMELEDDHYTTASKFLAYAEHTLEEIFTDPDSVGLKPKEAIDLMVKMIQIQRISVGASPMGATHGKGNNNGIPMHANLEVIMRTIAQQAGIENQKDPCEDTTKLLLQDPKALQQAQELIIRMSNMSDSARKLPTNTNTDTFDD